MVSFTYMDKKVILVIDDDISVLETVDFILTESGYNVLLASNGEEGLNIVKDQWVDGIILDLKMPKVSGYLFSNLVDKESKNPNTNILLLTGQPIMVGDCKIEFPNIVGKMTKPFNIKDLQNNVKQLLIKTT